MRPRADGSRSQVLSRDARSCCRVEGTTEAAVNGKGLSSRRRRFRQRYTRANRLGLAGHSIDDDAGDKAAFRIDRNGSDRVPHACCGCDEMQRFTRQCSPNRNDRIRLRRRSPQCQPNNCARGGARRCDEERRALSPERRRGESTECNDCIGAGSHRTLLDRGSAGQANA